MAITMGHFYNLNKNLEHTIKMRRTKPNKYKKWKRKIPLIFRRKNTRTKYDPPYTKKSIIKGTANSNHHSVEEVSLDDSNKLITYGNTFR